MLIISDGPIGSTPITPAHRYVYQGDFAKILEDIERGEIPCGSGQPFPVEFADPNDDLSKMNQGWDVPTTTYNGGNNIYGFQFGSMG